jgi:hypothetical protein
MASSRDCRPLLPGERGGLKMAHSTRRRCEGGGHPGWIPAFAGMTKDELVRFVEHRTGDKRITRKMSGHDEVERG